MLLGRRWGAALLVAAALLGAACSDDDDGGAPAAAERDERDALDVPPEVAGGAAGWPVPGGDYANTRAKLDPSITTGNVDALEVGWSVPLPGAGVFGNASTTPVIVDGAVYVQDLRRGHGSRTSGHVMQWPPPRPLPTSNPSTSTTSMPAAR